MNVKKIISRVLNPHVLIPAVIAIGLLSAVLAIGNPGKVWALMLRAGWPTLVVVAAITLPYLAARGLVWHQLLDQQEASVPLDVYLVAFAAGEFAKDLPGGAYVEDYLLSRASVPVAKSVTATTALSALEAILALPVVLVLGVPGWSWLRLSLGLILATYVVVIAILWFVTNPHGAEPRLTLPKMLRPMMDGVRDFMDEAAHLVCWRTLRENLLPTILYCGVVLGDIYLIGHAIGAPHINVDEAAVVFGFITLSQVLLPIPTSLGVTEASGAGALVAFGASPALAVAVLLLLRVLLTGTTMIITGAIMLLLWRRVQPELPPPSLASEGSHGDSGGRPAVSTRTSNGSQLET
ncbi:MAG TPA: lysylphosphatidylglycerol synthase transmembrane domain-containing protein [Thermomicrobiaceae bacterium]|nr:lysylphosphatidylglycerol synthase transmembrane domain-containing protein [Thermomicrobiaceae bacterium]